MGAHQRDPAPRMLMTDIGFVVPQTPTKTVLVAVHEPAIRELISVNLRSAGFYPVQAESHAAGQMLIAQVLPDAVLLDLDSPEIRGMSLASDVKALGKGRHIPILMLTRSPGEVCGSDGSNCGADDCVAKPFAPSELVVRLARLLGRSSNKQSPGHLVVGPLELDPAEHTVKVRGAGRDQTLAMPGSEFKLLHHFMSTPDRVHSREQLLAKVWRNHAGIDPRTVDQNIKRLRSNLASAGLEGSIETVRGVGYRLSAQRLHARFMTPA
jgi:two-component system, OmpR family, phosphate regulon response regulator PhoB